MKKALIIGISGQDGTYLADLLLSKGYDVCGSSRDAQMASFHNLKKLGIYEKVSFESMSPVDFRSVLQVITKVEPDEIYNLSGQSSVGLSFEQPVETMESITIGTLNLLEAIRFSGMNIRFYNAGSGECFGDTNGAADENTPFRPKSPYGVAKSAAFWEVANYREAYSLQAYSGILFNHESPLRPERFVTRKIVASVCRIADGSREKLHLGNTAIRRDWGWAPEYVEAMWLMLQHQPAEDFVICTGESHSLEEFVIAAFREVGLNWRDHVVVDHGLFRPSELSYGNGNPRKAHKKLNWRAESKMRDVVKKMVEHEKTIRRES